MQQFVYANEGKILLKELEEDDKHMIYEMYQDYDASKWWTSKELSQERYKLLKEARGKVFGAVLNDRIIGHADLVMPESKEDPVYLIKLEIHDDYRRRKFGIELVRYSAIIMKELGYQSYVTWPNTDKSKGLYKKVGLKEIRKDPQLQIGIKERLECQAEKKAEISILDRPKDLEIIVGCPWGREYTWLKSFKAGAKNLVDFKGPFVHKVAYNDLEGIVMMNGKELYIYAPQEASDKSEFIKELLIYGNNLAYDNGVEDLKINLRQEIWDQVKDINIWEIKLKEKRLEMRMDF